MKFVFFVMLAVLAGAFAMPQTAEVDPAQGRILDVVVRDYVERIIRWVRNRGLDPLDIVERNLEYSVPGWFNLRGLIENFRFTGLSDIRINNLSYNILFGRLDFDFSMPELKATLRNGEVQGTFLTREIDGRASGSLVIENIRFKGVIIFILTTTSIEVYNINVEISMGSIQSNANIVGSRDYSEAINNALNVRLPAFLSTYRNEINVLLGEGIRRAVSWWNVNRPW